MSLLKAINATTHAKAMAKYNNFFINILMIQNPKNIKDLKPELIEIRLA